MPKKQSILDRFHEHSGAERKEHGYHKPKSKKKSYDSFKHKEEEKLEEKIKPGIHKKVHELEKKKKKHKRK